MEMASQFEPWTNVQKTCYLLVAGFGVLLGNSLAFIMLQ